jgi:hypothetical protein
MGKTGPKPKPVAERFWANVQITDSCWLWTGKLDHGGYGVFYVRRGVFRGAHRVSWELTRNAIPPGLWVLHNCPGGDNPACVNPLHLFLGTHRDNVDDAVQKGRMRRGSRHGVARLNEQTVRELRLMYAAGGVTFDDLAAEYGVPRGTIWDAVHGRNWKYVD